MSGGRVAHPLLISCANISMDFRNKASNHAFQLLALLPIPHYINQKRPIHSVLENRLIHECLDIVLAPLKKAAEIGSMLSDPVGSLRWCFTPLAAYIVDTPESALLACVGGKTSSVTTATYREFGDSFQHPPRLASGTLAKLYEIELSTDPWDLDAYWKAASTSRLNGVHRPFWRDWALAEPSTFLTPEPLHHWHKQFWDHDVKWCIHVIGAPELDFRFSLLQPHTGLRHFKAGISTLKQVSGRDHREIQKYIIPVIAGAVTPSFLIAIRSLLDFRYLAQSPVVTIDTLAKIQQALRTFHDHKQAIIDSGGRRGKNGVLEHWQIPKLEFLQSVVPNIVANGAAIQWSADTTEHAHIEVVKKPCRASNNHGYESQICRHLDRLDKLSRFDLSTSMAKARISLSSYPSSLDNNDSEEPFPHADDFKVNSAAELLQLIDPIGSFHGANTLVNPHMADYFHRATLIQQGLFVNASSPARTFHTSHNTVIHLSRDPSIRRQPVSTVASIFGLPDLRPALKDLITRYDTKAGQLTIGGRRIAPLDCPLPFSDLEIWNSARLQTKTFHEPHTILSSTMINAEPPSPEWPYGRYDSAIFNIDSTHSWPESKLQGKSPLLYLILD